MKTPAYNDVDLIRFGKHSGKPLQYIPASYFHWWYHETGANDIKLKHYIENSLAALKEEAPDLIWKLKTNL